MSQSEPNGDNLGANGAYKFDPGYKWFILFGGGAVVLFCLLGPVIAASQDQALPPVLTAACALLSVGLFAAIASVLKRSRRVLQVNDDGIFAQDTRGNEIGGIRWVELVRVAATNKMAQLLLLDSAGNRRVVVDRNVQGFDRLRARILTEYARAFTLGTLPVELLRSNFWTTDAIVIVGAAVVMGFVSVRVYLHGQLSSGVALFLLFETLFSSYFLSINPQLFGPSQVFEDRIELKSLFKRRVMYKKDVTAVEIVDFTAGRSGTSCMVLVSAADGKQLKIQQRYGNLPDIYLTLKKWLAR